MRVLSGKDWTDALQSATSSAWRWECQGAYYEPYEQEPMRQYLAGEQPDLGFMDGWCANLREKTARGVRYGRVRVLTEPLTNYLRFELSFTHLNVEAGEDVRVMTAARARALELPTFDFWLVDDRWAGVMHFDEAKGFTHADVVDGPELDRFRAIRDLAWKDAMTFSE